MQLPLKLQFPQMTVQWASILNPVLANPMINGSALIAVNLADGTTTINHLLGRKMQGWFITDITEAATIYRPATSPFNSSTLTLISNAITVVNLWVY